MNIDWILFGECLERAGHTYRRSVHHQTLQLVIIINWFESLMIILVYFIYVLIIIVLEFIGCSVYIVRWIIILINLWDFIVWKFKIIITISEIFLYIFWTLNWKLIMKLILDFYRRLLRKWILILNIFWYKIYLSSNYLFWVFSSFFNRFISAFHDFHYLV